MKLVLASLLLAPALAFADVAIEDNEQTVTVDCEKDKTVSITGNKATVTLTGVCDLLAVSGNDAIITGSAAKVAVAGNNNQVKLEAVDRIATPGNKNIVTWKKGVTKAKPKVSNPGNKNKISKVK